MPCGTRARLTAYVVYQSLAFAEREVLLAALAAAGFTSIKPDLTAPTRRIHCPSPMLTAALSPARRSSVAATACQPDLATSASFCLMVSMFRSCQVMGAPIGCFSSYAGRTAWPRRHSLLSRLAIVTRPLFSGRLLPMAPSRFDSASKGKGATWLS